MPFRYGLTKYGPDTVTYQEALRDIGFNEAALQRTLTGRLAERSHLDRCFGHFE